MSYPSAPLRHTVADSLAEVFPGKDTETSMPLSTSDREQLLRELDDFGTSERTAALDLLAEMIRKAERDASLLDGRHHDEARYDEALRLVGLLKASPA